MEPENRKCGVDGKELDFPNGRLLRINIVADRLGISAPYVYKLLRLGRLRGIRIGRSVRVSRTDLAAFVNDCRK